MCSTVAGYRSTEKDRDERPGRASSVCEDDEVNAALLLSVGLGALLVLTGVVLLIACLWWRMGASPSARWWVRREPIDAASRRPVSEGAALVLLPMLAVTLMGAGLVAALFTAVDRYEPWAIVILVLVMLGICAGWFVARLLVLNRTVLPLWLYPGWLREHRRAERNSLHSRG